MGRINDGDGFGCNTKGNESVKKQNERETVCHNTKVNYLLLIHGTNKIYIVTDLFNYPLVSIETICKDLFNNSLLVV